jgi:hypothetical protein
MFILQTLAVGKLGLTGLSEAGEAHSLRQGFCRKKSRTMATACKKEAAN